MRLCCVTGLCTTLSKTDGNQWDLHWVLTGLYIGNVVFQTVSSSNISSNQLVSSILGNVGSDAGPKVGLVP